MEKIDAVPSAVVQPTPTALPDAPPAEILVKDAGAWGTARNLVSDVPVTFSSETVKLRLRALSWGELNEIEEKNPMPQPPTKRVGRRDVIDERDPAYLQARGQAIMYRMIATLELCWSPIPGETKEAKAEWALHNVWREGDMLAIIQAIRRQSGDGKHEEAPQDAGLAVIRDVREWAKLTQRPKVFKLHRHNEILLFTVCGIPGERVRQIEVQTTPASPPLKAVRQPDGRLTGQEPDPENPEYVRQVGLLRRVRETLLLEASLGFTFPQEDPQGKLRWLEARPADEVEALLSYVRYTAADLFGRTIFGLSA